MGTERFFSVDYFAIDYFAIRAHFQFLLRFLVFGVPPPRECPLLRNATTDCRLDKRIGLSAVN